MMTLTEAKYQEKILYKGNILQYKNTSSNLTKKQKYAKIANKLGPGRTKVFATQSQTYSNPNTTSLTRIDSQIYLFPNEIVGAPNNISGPFQYAVPNPFGCPNTNYSLEDGGALICGSYQNPCTKNITSKPFQEKCFSSSCSNVPGNSILCWNSKIATYFPRSNYRMNNSNNKWPTNYKFFVSALQ